MRQSYYLLAAIVCLLCTTAHAQTNRLIKQGNNSYQKGDYKTASADYLEALKKNPNNVTPLFNLGNSLYQQKQYDQSRKIMNAAAKSAPTKDSKSAVNYNIGNSYMAQQKWEDAIDAYKIALKNNPQDGDAKYNLSYAEQMLKKQQQQGGGKNNKQDKNQKNKDQQNKNGKNDQNKNGQNKGDQNKDGQNKDQGKDGQNKDDQNKDQQNQSQGQPSKLSQQQADQLLNALQQEEKKLQDKKDKEKGVPVKMQKDW